ncbi:hypothetical protein, partial [uncultured Paraburkholderia sp.]|uniref:hypothetical protein n=1 Tax=uncultured Paraburkholderia sp. TaxID=1822466 RepID=UPI00338DEB95
SITTSSIPTVHWNIARHASSGAEPIHQLKCEAVSGSTGANPVVHVNNKKRHEPAGPQRLLDQNW